MVEAAVVAKFAAAFEVEVAHGFVAGVGAGVWASRIADSVEETHGVGLRASIS